MGLQSTIEWTDATWNPVTGCTKVSPGCRNCYAERMAVRLRAMGQPNYRKGFEVAIHPHTLRLPLTWRRPRQVFVNSMGDLFHDEVPEAFIRRVFETMEAATWHRFQVLTKRAGRLRRTAPRLPWPENVWMGVTVECTDVRERIDDLRTVPAAVRFLSAEPLLGPLTGLDLAGIHWVIAGGESGPGARPIDPAWARDLRDQCLAAGVPFFFKQWGGRNKKAAGRVLDGRTWGEMPRDGRESTAPVRTTIGGGPHGQEDPLTGGSNQESKEGMALSARSVRSDSLCAVSIVKPG
ncbi:MAG: phage Gp37/Gp68 family protein [Deferrisomatales bacterium]|nr:phage Gp37/Gp68 family protein [Deferrisomatales bacterium]